MYHHLVWWCNWSPCPSFQSQCNISLLRACSSSASSWHFEEFSKSPCCETLCDICPPPTAANHHSGTAASAKWVKWLVCKTNWSVLINSASATNNLGVGAKDSSSWPSFQPKEGQSQRSQRTMKNFHSCLTSDCLTTALIVAVAWSHATFLSMGLSWRHLTMSRAMQRREGWQKCASWCCASSASVPGQWWQFDNSW